MPSLLEYEDGNLVIEHLYIERRMTPLNLYLQNGSDADVEHGVKEYGNAVKELMKANIFPGDMLYKNFGVTRHGRVVFYDYDEIEYLTDCNVRRVPARNEEDELSGEPWYRRPARHLSGDLRAVPARRPARARRLHEASRGLFDPALWQASKDKLIQGELPDFIRTTPRCAFACATRASARRTRTMAQATRSAA